MILAFLSSFNFYLGLGPLAVCTWQGQGSTRLLSYPLYDQNSFFRDSKNPFLAERVFWITFGAFGMYKAKRGVSLWSWLRC